MMVGKNIRPQLTTWKFDVLEVMEKVLSVVHRIRHIKNIPTGSPLRWKVVKFQIDELGLYSIFLIEFV